MAVTTTQLENVAQQGAFQQRVEYALTVVAENIASEATNTPLHAQRARLSAQILNNPTGYVPNFAQGVVAQLPLATTNMVGTTDVDTTDATLQTVVSSIYNDYLMS